MTSALASSRTTVNQMCRSSAWICWATHSYHRHVVLKVRWQNITLVLLVMETCDIILHASCASVLCDWLRGGRLHQRLQQEKHSDQRDTPGEGGTHCHWNQ